MRAASFMISACSRGTMYPGVAPHSTGSLPMASINSLVRVTTAASVPACVLSSTTGIR